MLLRLHTNENPLAVSDNIARAVVDVMSGLNRYPSVSRSLAVALAEHHRVPETCVLTGAGSAELITLVWRAFTDSARAALFYVPAFELYPLLSQQCGSPEVAIPVAPPGRAAQALSELTVDRVVGVVVISNPHNPTGELVSRRAIAELATRVPESTVVLNDEAYYEYASPAPDDLTLAELSMQPNIITTRSFSKIYGLAGLRVGYAIAQPELLDRLARLQTPFSLSTIAGTAAIAALADPDSVDARRTANASSRRLLQSELSLRGFAVRDSQANFLFVRPPRDGVDWPAELLARDIRVQPFESGLRVGVDSEENVKRLTDAIDQIVSTRIGTKNAIAI